jgi:hypothetical protein
VPAGVQAAQLIHAAGESYGVQRRYGCDCATLELTGCGRSYNCQDLVERFNPSCKRCSGTGRWEPIVYAVALHAASEQELLELEARLVEAKIHHAAIREPDAPWNGQLMAIGIHPRPREDLKRFTRRFQLVK